MARVAKATPAELGFRQPAEWEPHRATWLGWPHHADDWPGKLPAIVWVYTEIIRRLVRGERVSLLVQNERAEKAARDALGRAGADLSAIDFLRVPTDRAWMRDTAPSFVKNDEGVALVDWEFNGWAKYPNFRRDNRVPSRMPPPPPQPPQQSLDTAPGDRLAQHPGDLVTGPTRRHQRHHSRVAAPVPPPRQAAPA